LKIKAWLGLLRKQAIIKIYINQSLTGAISLRAQSMEFDSFVALHQ
jgi:hypothetical protein